MNNKVQAIQPLQLQHSINQYRKTESKENFQVFLKNAINQVNVAQKESEIMTNKLITGEVQDLHQVMIAAQKASITLDLTVQVRNKVVEAYQEIMRMQV